MEINLNKKIIVIAIISAMSMLQGCSSSGGGNNGGNENDYIQPDPPETDPPETDPPETDPPENEPEPEPPPSQHPNARVAVVDYEFDLSGISTEDRALIKDEYTIRKGAEKAIIDSNEVTRRNHGGRVANVLMNTATNKDFEMDVVDIGEGPNTDTFYTSHTGVGVGEAVDKGARVVNLSFGNGYMNVPTGNCYQSCKDEIEETDAFKSIQRLITGNDGYGATLIRSAGNSGAELQTSSYYNFSVHDELKKRTLIAGGSRGSGSDRHPSSNYPGSDETLQSMFLTAPYSYNLNGRTVYGTSFSAPQISAYAISLVSTWPHLKADEVAQRLLETASKNSYLYDQNDCGENGDLNCGYFYMGQGEADIEEAFKPSSELKLPTGEKVNGEYVLAKDTLVRTSSIYGDALLNSEELSDIASFDDLGRDYNIDLTDRLREYSSYQDRISKSIRNTLNSSKNKTDKKTLVNENNFIMELTESPNGNFETKMNFGFNKGSFYVSQKENKSGSIYENNHPSEISMLSSSTHYNSEIMPNAINRTGFNYNLNDKIDLYSEYEKTSNNAFISDKKTNSNDDFSRIHLGADLNLDKFSLNIGAYYQEDGSDSFGMKGNGLFNIQDSGEINAISLKSNYQLNDNLSFFAMVEKAESNDSKGLNISTSGLSTTSTGAGFNWKKDNEVLSLSFVQPPKIDNGSLTMSIPVGRTLDGNVIREDRTVSLSPSGQQKDIELGYRINKGENNEFMQINMLHVIEPGHIKEASSDNTLIFTWGREF